MRKLSLVFVAAIAASTFGITPAHAATPAPTGTVNCSMAGTLTLNQPLTNTPSTKALKVKGAASGTSCDHSGVTGGKAPITGVAVKISGSLPAGSSCASLATLPFGKTKIQVKWQGLNPSNKTMTVAVDNTFLDVATLTNTAPITVQMTTQAITKGAFAGQTLTLNLALDQDTATLLGQCGGSGITSLGFGSVNASNVTSP